MRFGANVSFLWSELPFVDRFAAARRAGFDAVEFHWPTDTDPADVAAAVRDAAVAVCLMNFAPDLAGQPDRYADWRAHVPVALALAEQIGCPLLHALPGLERPGQRPVQLAFAAEQIAFAADAAAGIGAGVVVEPLNPVDNGPVLIQTPEAAVALLDRVDRPNTGLQIDAYHMAMTGRDPVSVLQRYAERIRHVQVADWPGRGEAGTGTLDITGVLAALGEIGYAGAIGLEYRPSTGDTEASLRAWDAYR
jgi:hydroxypyruvate isomerase